MRSQRDGIHQDSYSKHDRGSGSLNDYRFDLIPRSAKIKIELAGSDACQDELQNVLAESDGELETAGGKRTIDEERVDAPMEVRLFTGRRVSGVVGVVPRGLEAAVDEALVRLERASKPLRIPAVIVKTKWGLRVQLVMGLTRSP